MEFALCSIVSLIADEEPRSLSFPRIKASIMAVLLVMVVWGVHHEVVEDAMM